MLKVLQLITSYLEGRPFEDENVGESVDWKINDVNISEKLKGYRRKAKEHAINKEAADFNLNSIEELSINSIFYITKKSKGDYGIEDKLWEVILKDMESTYKTEEDHDISNFQVDKLRPIYKQAHTDLAAARSRSKKLLGDTKTNETEQMTATLLNFLTILSKQNILEDIFTKKYVTPLVSSYFIETEYLEVTGCGEESRGSKDRRKNGFGRKPNMMYKVVVDQNNLSIFFLEIKPKEQCDIMAHPGFTKLANLMKDEIDRLLIKNCPVDIPIYGMLVGGRHAFILGLDLCFTGLHRLFDVTSFCFPASSTDLAALDHTFDVMFHLMGLVNKSMEKTINFFKQTNEIKTPPLRRQFYVKSFHSPTRTN
ncbi:hypothetical protein G6F43_004090 [Rhizopus delemar]|nr:hypothetical protein G6F43_004090 [Rhizopus delemar]